MVRKVYDLQRDDPSQGDFYELVCKDKQMVGLNLSNIEISQMDRGKFKSLVEEKTKQAAFKNLLSAKEKH